MSAARVQGLVEEDGAEHGDEDDDERAEHGHVQGPPLPQAPRHQREREPGRHETLQIDRRISTQERRGGEQITLDP